MLTRLSDENKTDKEKGRVFYYGYIIKMTSK